MKQTPLVSRVPMEDRLQPESCHAWWAEWQALCGGLSQGAIKRKREQQLHLLFHTAHDTLLPRQGML